MAFSPSTFAHERAPGAGVTAVLGPTNTGKTHLAIERMLAHSSGVIGLPLRLLAREVYNKIADRAGVDSVALVTGEVFGLSFVVLSGSSEASRGSSNSVHPGRPGQLRPGPHRSEACISR